MYADRVESASKSSIKDRLNGNFPGGSIRRRQVTGKRQREDDDKWEHDLFEEDEPRVSKRTMSSTDLRLKLQKKSKQQNAQSVRGSRSSGVRDLREKLSGVIYPQKMETDPPKPKQVSEVSKPVRKSVIAEAPPPEKKTVASSASKKKTQKVESVDSFLQSLGLEKYSITFQAEEVDMAALLHMTDEDLKAMGIPMGPRKKILLALEYVHESSMQAQVFAETSDVRKFQNAKESVDTICGILANHRGSVAIDSAMNSTAVADINITPLLAQEVLKKLSHAGLLALSFFRWAEKQKGTKHTTESYNTLIESLGKIKQFKMAWNLVEEMRKQGMLSKDSFALISRRYARGRRVKEAIEAFEKMEKFGLRSELEDYNRLIDTLSKSRNVETAQQLFDKWKNTKFKPDVKSYTILLEGWGRKQNLLRLDEVYREMKCDGFQPDVVSYGIMINAYCKAKKFEEAVEKFQEMERNGIKATPHIYCTLINGLGSEKRLDQALKFFELAKISGCALEAPTYNAVVGAYCWAMRMQDAYRIIDEMRVSRIGPNSRTYDIIIHHLIKARRTRDAYAVFQRMSDEAGCEPTSSTYEIIVQMFCNEDRTNMALRVWNQMKAKGIIPGMHMFCTLINNLCHENKLEEACAYFQEMMDVGIRPSDPLFKIIKQALLEAGREDMVLILFKKLQRLRGVQITC
ncbi:OLC1v1006765C1 [Oldenlandia corymbosa var. corymbosa]|uniref:OLC1v1006765C1 n=1 Tax=Oldenlandia corymbosa var. corymbosa TaxID=529605 RepID=A0AAV1DJ94_OLDCO|nr:OLC1v1006765C1 [Oldenlandia corymbosa var. corymbosa]